MIRACEMNMCNGDYVFMLPGITVEARFDEQKMWYKGDERDAAAQNAFKYLLYVRFASGAFSQFKGAILYVLAVNFDLSNCFK